MLWLLRARCLILMPTFGRPGDFSKYNAVAKPNLNKDTGLVF